jgi:hypothetical protein
MTMPNRSTDANRTGKGRRGLPESAPQEGANPQLGALERALRGEAALLGELGEALLQQRAGVASSDPDVVQAGSDRVAEVMAKLGRARSERQVILVALVGAAAPLYELEARLHAPLPAGLFEARAELGRLAHRAADELSVNRTVIRRAIERGDTFLRMVMAKAREGVPTYAESAARSSASDGSSFLFDKAA